MQVLGLNLAWTAILALPAVLLIAFGFASLGMAITSYMKNFQQMDWIAFVLMPMFLFSATFYPITVYPEPVQLHRAGVPALARGGAGARADDRGAQLGHARPRRVLRGDDLDRAGVHHKRLKALFFD